VFLNKRANEILLDGTLAKLLLETKELPHKVKVWGHAGTSFATELESLVHAPSFA
jgi:hypothetical protein